MVKIENNDNELIQPTGLEGAEREWEEVRQSRALR